MITKKITRKRLEKFLTPYATDIRVLDIGAGGSAYGALFPNRTTIDIDPQRKPDIVGDAHSLPFQDGEFEMVLCTEVLEHLLEPQKAINEMYRVVKPGGRCILTTRFMYPKHDTPHDYWRFTDHALKHLFSAWHIEVLEPETAPFSSLAVFVQRIGFQTTLRLNAIMKGMLFMLAAIAEPFDQLVVSEFGDIKKTNRENGVFASGFYIVARKEK